MITLDLLVMVRDSRGTTHPEDGLSVLQVERLGEGNVSYPVGDIVTGTDGLVYVAIATTTIGSPPQDTSAEWRPILNSLDELTDVDVGTGGNQQYVSYTLSNGNPYTAAGARVF